MSVTNIKKYISTRLLISTIIASSGIYSIEAYAFTLDFDRQSLARPWGYDKRGQEVITTGYSMRDSQGNLQVSNQASQSKHLKGFGYNFYSNSATTGFGNSVEANGNKLTANEFNVVTTGSFNTVLIQNVQETKGDLVLNGQLDTEE